MHAGGPAGFCCIGVLQSQRRPCNPTPYSYLDGARPLVRVLELAQEAQDRRVLQRRIHLRAGHVRALGGCRSQRLRPCTSWNLHVRYEFALGNAQCMLAGPMSASQLKLNTDSCQA